MLAYGANNHKTARYGYVKLNKVTVWQASWFGRFPNLRGVNTVLVDPFNCSAQESRRFDTWHDSNAAVELKNYLQQLNRGKIVVGVTADEPTRYLESALATLRAMGADVADVEIRGSFGFVAQKDFPDKTVLRKALTQEESFTNQPRFNVTITGKNYNVAVENDTKPKFHYADFPSHPRQTRDVPVEFCPRRRRFPRFPGANGLAIADLSQEFFKPFRHVAINSLKSRNIPVTSP